eukprot:g9758.t1
MRWSPRARMVMRPQNTKQGRARRAIGMPGAAAVLARVSPSCKIESMGGGEGGGLSSEQSPYFFGTPLSAGGGAPVGAEYCRDHAEDGMVKKVNSTRNACTYDGCAKQPSFGEAGGKAEFCRNHAVDGMLDVVSRRCGHDGCTKHPLFGKAGGKAEYCRHHAEDGMMDVKNKKRCARHGCTMVPAYGKVGGKAEYCRGHAEDGMVDVLNKRCSRHRCSKRPSYGKAGGKAEYCRDHAEDGMVDVRSKRCTRQGCSKQPSYGMAGGKAEFCQDHAKAGMINPRSVFNRKAPTDGSGGASSTAVGDGTARRAGGGEKRGRSGDRSSAATETTLSAKGRESNKRTRHTVDPGRTPNPSTSAAADTESSEIAAPATRAWIRRNRERQREQVRRKREEEEQTDHDDCSRTVRSEHEKEEDAEGSTAVSTSADALRQHSARTSPPDDRNARRRGGSPARRRGGSPAKRDAPLRERALGKREKLEGRPRSNLRVPVSLCLPVSTRQWESLAKQETTDREDG